MARFSDTGIIGSILFKLGYTKNHPYYDDLYSVGLETLWKAEKSFDPQKGNWEAYVKTCMENAIKKELKRLNKDNVTLSLDYEYENEDGEVYTLEGSLSDESATAEDQVINKEKANELNQLFNESCVSEKEKELLMASADGYTKKELASRYALSPDRIKQIKKKALLKLMSAARKWQEEVERIGGNVEVVNEILKRYNFLPYEEIPLFELVDKKIWDKDRKWYERNTDKVLLTYLRDWRKELRKAILRIYIDGSLEYIYPDEKEKSWVKLFKVAFHLRAYFIALTGLSHWDLIEMILGVKRRGLIEDWFSKCKRAIKREGWQVNWKELEKDLIESMNY